MTKEAVRIEATAERVEGADPGWPIVGYSERSVDQELSAWTEAHG